MAVGRSYKWTVSFVSDRDGGRYLSSGEFKIADEHATRTSKNETERDAMIEDWFVCRPAGKRSPVPRSP